MNNFVFVICPSFHGATLLSCLLNNHSAITSMGDTIPRLVFIENDAECSCGERINSCEFWENVINEVNPDKTYRDGCLIPFYPVLTANPKVNETVCKAIDHLAYRFGINIWRVFAKPCLKYIDDYTHYCSYICNLQNTQLFIGGQKNMLQVRIIMTFLRPEQRVKIIHLIRNPKAVYYSHFKRNADISLETFCRNWNSYHQKASRFKDLVGKSNYSLIRYEDLSTSPEETMDNLQDFLGVKKEALITPNLLFRKKHIIGNTMLKSFNGEIILDNAWKNKLSKAIEQDIATMTQQESQKHGYES